MIFEKFKELIKNPFKNKFGIEDSVEIFQFCEVGDLNSIKKIIESRKFKGSFPSSGHMFSIACRNGHLPIVEYMLLPENNNVFAGIYSDKSKAIQVACTNKHLDVTKYLINHQTFKDYINIHIEHDSIFKKSCINEDIEILRFLIFELKINKTEEIEKFIDNFPNLQGVKMMQTRDNYENLTKELNTDNFLPIYKKKNKI